MRPVRNKSRASSFTHVDPFEDTESKNSLVYYREQTWGFTHVDPFEDTERQLTALWAAAGARFTHVDPFEDTESLLFLTLVGLLSQSFTHVDPFEDTESVPGCHFLERRQLFHPRRSVRGY